MSSISSYANKTIPVLADKVVGSDSEDGNSTKNFTLEKIQETLHEDSPKADMTNSADLSATLTLADTYYELSSALLVGTNLTHFTFSNWNLSFNATQHINQIYLKEQQEHPILVE